MNLTTLTIGEIASIEKYSGVKIGELDDEAALDTRTMCAFGYVVAKRLGLEVDIKDIEQLSIDEVTALINQDLPSWTGRGENAQKIIDYLDAHPIDSETAGE